MPSEKRCRSEGISAYTGLEVIALLAAVLMIIRRSDKPFQSLSLVSILPPMPGAMTVYTEAKQVTVLQLDRKLTREHAYSREDGKI